MPQSFGKLMLLGAGIGAVVAVPVLFLLFANAQLGFQIPFSAQEQNHRLHAVVSAHELATEAGLDMLRAGGTAADAAVAVAATLTVVEPWFSSVLGGGTWALYYEAETNTITSLDGVGPVGSKATVADYQARAEERGMHQANVPGSWDAWMLLLDRYGTLDLPTILAPAILAGQNGYPVNTSMQTWVDRFTQEILNRPDAAAIYAPTGELLREGDTIYQRNLADTLAELAEAYRATQDEGRGQAIQAARDYYYRGPIAEALVAFSDAHGGYLTEADFQSFEAAIVQPISIQWNDEIEIFQNPPNSQGITMLLALNILKEYDFSQLHPDDADAVHLQAEAVKLAFADRYHHVGDPARVEVPVAKLLSNEHASRQWARIDFDQTLEWPIADVLEMPQDAHTTTFHIVDQYGNAAAVTTSLGAEFLVVGDTGIHINNRMRMISLEDGDPNQLTPGYKVRHTSNPYMALRNGTPYILGGNTGVDTQPQGQMQQFLSVVEFGLSAQDAITRPRFISTAFPAGTFPYDVLNTLQVEDGFPQETLDELEEKGHTLERAVGIVGSANMLVIDQNNGSIQIGAEPRGGTAFGLEEAVSSQQ
jgi:gamma-glutamyltranspeptidase / glutathione hydrolase